jgi:GT2 family glycosyltransferase
MFVTIPAYRAPEKLARCVAAVKAQTIPCQLYVHDNSVNNSGFTAGVNVGLRQAIKSGAEFALVLNQDVYLPPDACEKLTAFMRDHPRCGIAGVKQYDEKTPDLVQHGGCGQAFPYGMHVRGYRSRGDCAVSLPMPWVNGAILCARMSAVLNFGLMDENMYLVGSDSDWCYTARQRNYEVWYCADTEVVHEGGITAGPPILELQPGFARDMGYWRDKWVGTKIFKLLNSWTVAMPG